MKRFHVHVAVPDLAESIRFYSTLFGAEPAVLKTDYAKWMLDDPRVNFAISQRGAKVGINHLGFQVDSGEELETLHVISKPRTARSSRRRARTAATRSRTSTGSPTRGHRLGIVPLAGRDSAVRRTAASDSGTKPAARLPPPQSPVAMPKSTKAACCS